MSTTQRYADLIDYLKMAEAEAMRIPDHEMALEVRRLKHKAEDQLHNVRDE